MEALYKMKKPKTGQADRSMRAKLKDTASKSSRANLLDSKRRIPLSEVQPSNKTPEENVKEKPAISRAERLVVWKQQREEAKARQRDLDKKNPPFRPVGKKRPPVQRAPLHTPVVPKSALPTTKKGATSTSSSTASSTATNVKKAVKKTNVGPSRSSARLAAKQPATTSGTQKSATSGKKNPNVSESAKPRTRAQQTADSKKTVGTKPPVNRVRQGQSVKEDVKAVGSNKAAAPIRRKVSAKTQGTANERQLTTRSVASKISSTKNSKVKKGSVTKTKSKANRKTEAKVDDVDSNESPDPPTTPKQNSYIPVHPSPLLKSQVAPVRRETVYMPQFVNEPAWIPGVCQNVNFTAGDPNFDDAFTTASFSPFRFTAVPQQLGTFGSFSPKQPQQHQFVFEPPPAKLNYDIPESMDAELSQTVASPPAQKRRRSSRRCSRRIEVVTPTVVDSLGESSESKSEEDTCSAESNEEGITTGSDEGVDFSYFRGLHAGVTERFTRLCQEWEEKSNTLEQEYGSDDGTDGEGIAIEDVLGQIRTTVCQAQLLMRKKLKQYMSLVDEAEDLTVEKRANADDLQSFWDMVYFQVEDVQKKFDAIEMLEKNGWKHRAPTPAKKRAKKTKAGAKKAASSTSSSETNERLQAARDKRQAQRNRLKEMKLAAKRTREQEAESAVDQEPAANEEEDTQSQEEPLPTTPSSKKSKLAHTPKVSSIASGISYFRGLHAGVTERFTRLCQEWEEKSNALEQEYGSDDATDGEGIAIEDVLGQIRTTVCQAQLLMRKKLKQYMSLVDEAEDLTVEKRANADDLQSFWDMVYFQVEDVQKKFAAIEMLEKNGWKHRAPTPAKKRAKKPKAGSKKAVSSATSLETNERLQAARDKRQTQRNRLKEMKLAAKRAREQEAESAVEQEPGEEDTQSQEEPSPSPKKSKLARTPKVSSIGRMRRRSQRLLAKSVFSPIESTRSTDGSYVNEVPTGCLISLTPLKL